jgi:iron complex outermembrane receptor protein
MASGAAMAACAPAFAQEPATTDPAERGGITVVVVTADKRSEDLQDVATAVSAFTSEQRDNLGITTIQDLTNFTPGLSYNTALDRVSIRGIGRNTNNLTADPGVATYVDGVYNAQTFNAAGDPLFTDRIEVLRGPEGTLYGRNSIGGAVNSISKRPDTKFGGEIRGAWANYERASLAATVTGPIADNLQYRLNAHWVDQEDGYFKNLTGFKSEGGNIKSYYIEGQLQAQLGDAFDAWLKVSSRSYRAGYPRIAYVGPLDTAPIPTGTAGPGGFFPYCSLGAPNTIPCPAYGGPTNVVSLPGSIGSAPGNTDLRTFQSNLPGTQSVKDNYTVTAEATYDLGGMELKYVGGWQTYKLDQKAGFFSTGVLSYDYPCAAAGCRRPNVSPVVPYFYLEDKDFWSNELNLASTGDGPLQWIVGAYQYREDYIQPVNFSFPGIASVPAVRLPYFESNDPQRSITYYNTVNTGQSHAAFGQLDWQATDTLSFTGGLRYTRDEKEGEDMTRQQFLLDLPNALGQTQGILVPINLTPGAGIVPAPPFTPSTGAVRLDANGFGYRDYGRSWNATTGTLGAQWKPIDDLLLYAKYSRGYKSGGFNTGYLAASAETRPEFVDAYEVGYKGQPLDNLQINAALYNYKYKDMQIPLSVSIVGSPAQTRFFNIPEANSYGLETEIIWAATDALTFNLSYAHQVAEIEDTNGACFSDGNDPQAVFAGASTTGCPANGSQNVVGASLAQTPPNKVALNATYEFVFDAGSLRLSGNYLWRDETYSSIFNRAYNLAPAYDHVDLRAIWTAADGGYTLIGFAKNVFDEVGYESASGVLLTNSYANPSNPILGNSYALTPPRTYGVELQYRF